MGGPQGTRAEPESLELTGREALNDHVDRAGQAQASVAVSVMIEIKNEAALGGVQVHEQATAFWVWLGIGERTECSGGVAVRRFDLDDLRAEVGQEFGGVRTGDTLGELQDADSGEWQETQTRLC